MNDERVAPVEFVKTVPRILAKYAEVVSKNPGVFCDEKLLPCSKTVMKAALKVGWELAKTDEQRAWIREGWSLLSTFQPGVGDKPLGKTRPESTLDEFVAHNDLTRLTRAALEEMEENHVEFSAYLDRVSDPAQRR